MVMHNTIFIQIAAYRDPQLAPTIRDCLAQADHPENLVFCVAWQHADGDTLEEFANHPQVKVIDIDYRKSKGACWARNQIQQRYDGETYTLQLDSHHRFAKSWDTTCIQMVDQLRGMGHAKPLLTGYISSFDPDNDPAGRINVPWKMNFDRFIPEGAVFFLPASIDEHVTLSAPVAARFYSAHFCFTLGQFCKEVPHDPNYYFHGEEISIAARAFTWGYNLFHPHKVIAWHEYTRKGRTKHWDDHNGAAREQTDDKKDWGQRNADCHKRNRCLFSMDGEKYESIEWGPYGFGPIRTLRDYEKYAGINFQKRAVQQFTLDKKYPPNPWWDYKTDEEWDQSFVQVFKHCVDLQLNKFPHDDYWFWCVSFEDADGKVIHRKDADENECRRLLADARNPNGDRYIKLWREFPCDKKPHHVVVWPHSRKNGWGEKMTFSL